MRSIQSYFNPWSAEHNSLDTFKTFHWTTKTAIGFTTFIVGIITLGTCGCAAFRGLVEYANRFSEQAPNKPTTSKMKEAANTASILPPPPELTPEGLFNKACQEKKACVNDCITQTTSITQESFIEYLCTDGWLISDLTKENLKEVLSFDKKILEPLFINTAERCAIFDSLLNTWLNKKDEEIVNLILNFNNNTFSKDRVTTALIKSDIKTAKRIRDLLDPHDAPTFEKSTANKLLQIAEGKEFSKEVLKETFQNSKAEQALYEPMYATAKKYTNTTMLNHLTNLLQEHEALLNKASKDKDACIQDCIERSTYITQESFIAYLCEKDKMCDLTKENLKEVLSFDEKILEPLFSPDDTYHSTFDSLLRTWIIKEDKAVVQKMLAFNKKTFSLNSVIFALITFDIETAKRIRDLLDPHDDENFDTSLACKLLQIAKGETFEIGGKKSSDKKELDRAIENEAVTQNMDANELYKIAYEVACKHSNETMIKRFALRLNLKS